MHRTISNSERRDTYIAEDDFFCPQLPGATQHKPLVKMIGDLEEEMPKRNKKSKTNPNLSKCSNCGCFASFVVWVVFWVCFFFPLKPAGIFNN